MLQYFKTEEGRIRKLESREDGCWGRLTRPSLEELQEVSIENGIELEDLRAALDDEESSRIQTEENYTMILVDIPTIEKRNEEDWYVTIPMAIIVTNTALFTVSLNDAPLLDSFEGGKIKNFHTHMKTRFILQILYRNSALFLQYLRVINKKSDLVETKLHESTQNKELIELLELEKSLVYFSTSLRSNEVVMEKLIALEQIKKYPEDSELLQDVIIENKQAIEMTNIYSGILSGMMDAFASVISNNLNIVMKFLTTVTIVLSIPSIIFSAYGMNVSMEGVPFAQSTSGFLTVVLLAIFICVAIAWVFSRKKLF